MPLDEGGGRGGRSKPVIRRKKPPPPVTKQAKAFGGNVGVFVPPALVPAAPIRNPDQNKAVAPPKFTVKSTAQEQRQARELADQVTLDKRVQEALVAPVDLDTKIDLRATETATEQKARTGTTLAPRPKKGLLQKAVDLDKAATGAIGEGFKSAGQLLEDIGAGVGTAFAETAVEAAYGKKRGVGLGAQYDLGPEADAVVGGAKAGLTPIVYNFAGPDLANAAAGLEYSRPGLLFDMAMLPLAAGARPIKGARAAVAAGKAARAGKTTAEIAEIADEVYRGTRAARVKPLSAAHGRALKLLAEKEEEFANGMQRLADATGPARKDIEKAVKRVKAERFAAKQEVLYTRMRAQATWPTVGPDDPRFVDRDVLARRLIADLRGRKSALPPKASVRQVHDLLTFLDEQTEIGQGGRMWYENSAESIVRMAGGDPERAEKFAQLLAIYSPQQGILGNTGLAIRAWNEFQHALGDFENAGRVTTGQKWQQRAATDVMTGKGDWDGRKTNNFYVNFLEDINKEKYDDLVASGQIRPDGVTVDIWMARVFGFSDDRVVEGRYDFMESIVKQIAAERGWKPKQVQAAIWTAIKNAAEGPQQQNIDFAEGLARHRGQFNWEAAPAVGDDFSATYLSWPEEVQQAFMNANAHLVDDFLTDVGILGERSSIGAGVYGGPQGVEFNPAAATSFLTSAAPRVPYGKGTSPYRLHPVERVAITRAAAAIGQALKQESVAWIRPFRAFSKGHADTIHLPLGRAMTSAEAQELYRLLNRAGERVAIMHADTGVYLKNISEWSDAPLPNLAAKKSEEDFHGLVLRVAHEVFPDADGTPLLLASDGDLVESADYGLHLTTAGDGAGSGSAVRFQEAADRLAGDAEALRARFTEFAGDVARAEQGLEPLYREQFKALPDATRLAAERQAAGWLEQFTQLLADERGSISLEREARGLDTVYRPRTLTVNDLTQQMPKARSGITRLIENAADEISRATDESIIKDFPGIRNVTAARRVAKQAGRVERQEIHRRPAVLERHIKTLADVEEGSLEDVAHFWYAQLPEGYRDADGLRFVRNAQKEELDQITSGAALEQLNGRLEALGAAMREAETGSQAMRLLREQEQVRILITDLPNRAQDVGASIAKLDHLIQHAPQANEEILDALRALANDREKILVRAARLKPENAAARKRMVAEEWLQLEPDGTEIYMGHRLPREASSGRQMVAQVGAGTGRVGSPKGVGTKNRLVLATTGRVRASTRVALEDWSAGQVFETANSARDTLGKLGDPFDNRYREGYTLVNPKGRTIPPHWRTEELAAFSEGPESIEEVRELAQDMVDTFTARNRADWDRIVEEAEEQGVHWSELRMVRSDLVDRYYSQFRSFKGRSTPAVAYDMAVDFFATSIIFARVGYIPKNVVQNLIMSVPHQGAFLLVNAVRAGQVLADPQLRALVKAEVGFSGATQALSQESARRGPTKFLLGKVAGFVGSVADDPARISAFLHEAAAEGVISRVNPLLSNNDRKALVRLLTDPKQRPRLNDIRWRATEAMADFTRMTPDQARVARRLLIIPGWLMAGSRYPFHFAATHPIRSALIAYAVMGEPGAPEELQFNDPAWTYLHGKKYLQGIDTPWGRERTASLIPVTTPWELAIAGVGSVRGKTGPFDYDTPTAFDVVSPALSTIVEWAQGEGDAGRTAKRLFPGGTFVKDMISPPTDPPTYPEDVTRLGRLKREVGILPIEVVDEVESDLIAKPPVRPGARDVAPRPGGRGIAPRP